MAAGSSTRAGTRDIRRLSGLARSAGDGNAAIVASAAMAASAANGFLSKENVLQRDRLPNPIRSLDVSLPAGAIVASMFAVTYSLRFILRFFGRRLRPRSDPA